MSSVSDRTDNSSPVSRRRTSRASSAMRRPACASGARRDRRGLSDPRRACTPCRDGPLEGGRIVHGRSMTLSAFDGFHRGRPASPEVVVRLIRSSAEAVEAVRRGEVDWLIQPFALQDPNLIVDALADVNGLVFNEYESDFFVALFYNLREGSLFSEPALREAMELCIDKNETVAAATRGRGTPLQASVMPSHWAFDSSLRAPERDVAAAIRLIESTGWTPGSDGVYVRDGRRLAAEVPVPPLGPIASSSCSSSLIRWPTAGSSWSQSSARSMTSASP